MVYRCDLGRSNDDTTLYHELSLAVYRIRKDGVPSASALVFHQTMTGIGIQSSCSATWAFRDNSRNGHRVCSHSDS